MKKRSDKAATILAATVALLAGWVLQPAPSPAREVPALQARVNDEAAMLSAQARQQLEKALAAFERSESTQIAVLTVSSLEGEAIEAFALRAAEAWQLGQQGRDNGALMVIAAKERKIRIEVGYGLEGRLTDLVAGRIIRQIMVPAFRNGHFDQGILYGAAAMMEAVRGEFESESRPSAASRPHGSRRGSVLFPLILFAFLVMQLGRSSRVLGVLAGGALLPLLGGLFFGSGLLLLALIPLGMGAGLLAGLLGSGFNLGGGATRRGMPGGFWYHSGGGFSSGGFGGFSGGGGGFGGGGASGGW